MQSKSLDDIFNMSKSNDQPQFSQTKEEPILHKKRRRAVKNKVWSQKEEDRILKYALKLSQKEYEMKLESSNLENQIPKKLVDIEEVKVYIASEEEFLNPLKLFDSLWENDENSSGLVKIIPPPNWVASQKQLIEENYKPLLLDPQKRLMTRKQTLNELYKAKKFDHTKEYTLYDYQTLGKEIFREKYNVEEGGISLEQIEEDYWKECQNNEKPLTVQYAADIPIQSYFTKQQLHYLINEEKTDNENFSLLRVNIMKNSMLQFTKNNDENQISGITIPWLYMGMIYSSFCWHTEDLYLYSLNYMHEGAPKIWYTISHTQKEKMDEFIKTKYFATLLKEPDLVHRLTIHINPLELMKHGIKVYRVVQNPGEMIVTIPKGYHSGFSTGLNLAEAVNFSTFKWLDYGIKAQADYRKNNRKMPVFSMEWILMQNYENVKTSLFDDKNYKNKLKGYVNNLLSEEINLRVSLETFFKINKINYIIEEIEKNDNIENFECDMCTHFGFLSQLQCNNCKKKGCITHSIQCRCLPTDYTIRYRYLIKELQYIKSKKNMN